MKSVAALLGLAIILTQSEKILQFALHSTPKAMEARKKTLEIAPNPLTILSFLDRLN